MNSFPDRLNDQLERQWRGEQPTEPSQLPPSRTDHDPNVDELVTLAQRLQTISQLQADPDFSQRLEARILARSSALSRKPVRTIRKNRVFQRTYRIPFALGVALACLLFVAMAGTLTVAAQGADPNNPLYGVNRWVQQIQHPQTSSAVAQGNVHWLKAHDQLIALANLVDPAHATAYQQSLTDLDQQIDALAHSVEALPAGPDKDNLSSKLTTLKGDARQELHKLLPHLVLSEKLLTTDELGRLGDTVPRLEKVVMLVSHPQKQATITITGYDLQSGMQLLVDNQIVAPASSSQDQNGDDVFIVRWSDKQPPATLGILNPDGTVAQTSVVTFTVTEGNENSNANANANANAGGNNNVNSNGKGNTNRNGGGNTNGKGKGKATPAH
ncbi:MAG TPA: hypothetical protein VL485_17850 [Ktedonobacteraceae bacterium]|jgi:hypothetical protein|nr:hypothetical protein [Ktedonobacteraceae bacterium]